MVVFGVVALWGVGIVDACGLVVIVEASVEVARQLRVTLIGTVEGLVVEVGLVVVAAVICGVAVEAVAGVACAVAVVGVVFVVIDASAGAGA